MKPLGYAWLRDHFQLKSTPLSHESYLGTRMAKEINAETGRVVETYIPSYDPGDSPFDHLEFALKYDHLNLCLLRKIFERLNSSEIVEYLAKQPTGRYARQLGFIYEFLTGTQLELSRPMGGNYVPILDDDFYFTGTIRKNAKWRIDDNLLGSAAFCPVVRKTPLILKYLKTDWAGKIRKTVQSASTSILQRASSYFYFKETKSSFAIEREEIGGSREERFVAALRLAGKSPVHQVLSEKSLTELQHIVVEKRYVEQGFRKCQNYVGETMPDYSEKIHYICPPPQQVVPLMGGLLTFAERDANCHPFIRMAVASFQFVFIHPFEDGNGRLHRFLMHDFLARSGFIEQGVILPLSATVLENMAAYDRCLEEFSSPLLSAAKYSLDARQVLTVENPEELAAYYQYHDFTPQAEYLFGVLEETVNVALPLEIKFLEKYDSAKAAIQSIVDVPDKKMRRLLVYLHQNSGRLSKNKRAEFEELSAAEVTKIEDAFRAVFFEK